MDILGSIGSVITGGASGILGAFTGMIGSALTSFVKYKQQKLLFEHEKEMKKLEMDRMKLQAELKIKVVQTESEAKIEEKQMEALKESYKSLNKSYFDKDYYESLPNWMKPVIAGMMATLDFIRGIVRPTITIASCSTVFYMGYLAYTADPQSFVVNSKAIVYTALYTYSTIITWWFSDRSKKHELMSNIKTLIN